MFVLASVAMSFICGEATIRTISRFVDIYDIEMHKYALRLKRRSDHPLLLHEHVPNSQARLMGVDVRLNALGHRNGDLPAIKPDNERRIHVIGSSMCFGWGVPQEQTFTSRLERKLNKACSGARGGDHVRVINAGVGNTNTLHYVEQFKIQYRVTKPDIVIMQYFVNDSEIIGKDANSIVYEYSLLLAMLKQKVTGLMFELSGSGSLAEYYRELYDDEAAGWQAVQESVRELRDLTARENMELVVLLIPDLHDFSLDSAFTPIYEKIVSTFGDMGIDTLELIPELEARYGNDVQQAWVAKKDAHPNAEVHGIITDKLAAYLTSQRDGSLVSSVLHFRSPG